MQFFNCIIQSILQFISLETKISMSKSLEFSDFKFQFWQNLTQPKATLDTLCRLLWSLVWPVQCRGKPFIYLQKPQLACQNRQSFQISNFSSGKICCNQKQLWIPCGLHWSLVWPVQGRGKPAFRANTAKELRNMHKTVCSWGFVSLEQGTKEKQEFAIFRAY